MDETATINTYLTTTRLCILTFKIWILFRIKNEQKLYPFSWWEFECECVRERESSQFCINVNSFQIGKKGGEQKVLFKLIFLMDLFYL